MKPEDWDAVIATNLTSVFRLSKGVLKRMMKERRGRIVSLTSIVGLTGNAGQANYAAAKAGILGFTKSLAKEIASRGITVNAVAPGFIDTDMTRALNDEQRTALTAQVPDGAARHRSTTSPRRCFSCVRRARVTSPARPCTSTAACTWPEQRGPGLRPIRGDVCNSQTTEKQTKTSTHDLTAWRRRKCCPRIRARCGSPGIRSEKTSY